MWNAFGLPKAGNGAAVEFFAIYRRQGLKKPYAFITSPIL
jgi:hypothetical protein